MKQLGKRHHRGKQQGYARATDSPPHDYFTTSCWCAIVDRLDFTYLGEVIMKPQYADRLMIAALGIMIVMGTLFPVFLYVMFGDAKKTNLMAIKDSIIKEEQRSIKH